MDPTTLTITLSSAVAVGDNIQYGVQQTVVGLSSSSFLIGYFNGTSQSAEGVRYGPLSMTLVGVVGSQEGETSATGTVTIIQTANITTAVAFTITGDKVDSSSALFSYVDVEGNYGVSTILVSISSADSSIQFGSKLSFSTAPSLSYVMGYSIMDLDIIVLPVEDSTSSNPTPVQFVVLYSDISNQGRLTLTAGLVNNTLHLPLPSLPEKSCRILCPSPLTS